MNVWVTISEARKETHTKKLLYKIFILLIYENFFLDVFTPIFFLYNIRYNKWCN